MVEPGIGALPHPIAATVSERATELVDSFRASEPVRHVVIDGFLDVDFAERLEAGFPNPDEMPKSRDYMFSDKRELSSLDFWNDDSKQLHEALGSAAFARLLSAMGGDEIFVDPDYLGGGFHVGTPGSFLDLHVDFNIHPLHDTWLRRVNVLIYLNRGWEEHYGGHLRLTADPSVEGLRIAPIFNRAVIMECSDHSFHGYQRITFPDGSFRKSVAAYGYSEVPAGSIPKRTTDWRPEGAGPVKRVLARNWSTIVLAKNRVLGSGTAKNRR